MKTTLLIILTFVVSFAQDQIKLKVTNENPYELKESFKLIDKEDGYYDEVLSTASPNGTIYLLDRGNKQCHKFDQNGNHLLTFGKEGSGPGVFNQFIADVIASDNRVLFKNLATQTLMLFKSDGSFIKEIKGNLLIGAMVVIDGDNFVFYFPKNELSETVRMTLDKDGNEVSKMTNKDFEEGAVENMQKNFNEETLKKNLKRPASFMPFNGGFMQHYRGTYHIDFVSNSYDIKSSLTYDYNRVKIENLIDMASRMEKNVIKNASEKRYQFIMQVFEKAREELGGYFPDITNIIGTHKSHLFVQTKAKDNTTLLLDIISKDFKIVQQVKIKLSEITSAFVRNGYLLVNQTNDDEGPFTTVYKL